MYEEGQLILSVTMVHNYTVSTVGTSLHSEFRTKPQTGNSKLLVTKFPRFCTILGVSLEIDSRGCST